MVPVESTAFAVLALCVILVAIVQAIQLFPRPVPMPARGLAFIVLIVVVILALYAWVTTRMP